MKKVSMVKVALFRVVDQYTREDKCIIISMCLISKSIKEVKAFFDGCLAKHYACVAESEEHGPMPLKMAQAMSDACQKANLCVMVFNCTHSLLLLGISYIRMQDFPQSMV